MFSLDIIVFLKLALFVILCATVIPVADKFEKKMDERKEDKEISKIIEFIDIN